jgi:Asp-tRNA(Asn)/Glu-tRNA(Gln) amidotransferase A subunit family amidase
MGLSSRSGIVPLAHSQDVGGPIARTVADVAVLLDATVGADADDPVTSGSAGHIPTTYTRFLDRDGLRGARIGVLLTLFGDAPEDQRAGSVVRTALAAMAARGARLVDITSHDVPSDADGVAVIRYEFRTDIDGYLQRTPRAPVRSLADMLQRHVLLPALETAMARANEVTTLDTDEYRGLRARLAERRAALLKILDDNDLAALVYPTLRRTAAKIGEPQLGGNCAASAATGLPAITVPAGFADDGMPVGVEFLGRAFAEPELLRLAFSYETATHHRRLPPLTPAIAKKGME